MSSKKAEKSPDEDDSYSEDLSNGMDEDAFDDYDIGMDLDDLEGDMDGSDAMDLEHYADLARSQELTRTKSFEVLTEANLQAQSEEAIEEVKDMLSLPSRTAARLLLRHYRWNKERLISDMTTGLADKIRKEAGISSASYVLETPPDSDPKKVIECLICLEDVPVKDTYALGCGHRYCNNCWHNYLEFKTGEADCITTKCPFPKCNEAVHERAFHALLGPKAQQIYDRFVLRSLVDENQFIKFCPAPGCNNAVRVERRNRKEAVTCTCGFQFCFRCDDYEIGDHNPATCENVDAWLLKAGDESENVRWMIANTKTCPECRKPIEKNGGCMHMTCGRSGGGCGHEFCWLCRGPWREHGSDTGGYYACNKYDGSKAKEEDTSASAVKTELEEYMFYYHRYESHHNAHKIADEQRRQAKMRGEEIMDKFKVRAQDTNFLTEATEQLLANRKVLKWSYVYGYYINKKNSRELNLFQYLQEDLEKHTDKLSQLYETPLAKIADYQDFMKWKEQVTNYTRVTAGFLKKFVSGVTQGLTDV